MRKPYSRSILKFCIIAVCFLVFATGGFCQENEIEFLLDISSNTVPLPRVFNPNIDLSGRGLNQKRSWPQVLASEEVLNKWRQEIGFSGVYRLQYNLWEMSQVIKDKDIYQGLIANYEAVMRRVTDAGGIVILDIFSTPRGLGKVLDKKKSTPWDLKAFKELVKSHVRELSCNKRYSIWYEVWSAPDSDDFFLGRKQEYLNVYKAVAEGIKELEAETKIYIPLGGPSTSWWFQNTDGNSILTPETSLIYELIKFCGHYRLPLDFISWHAYSTDPRVEDEKTIYNKSPVPLIRDWLSYFKLNRDIPLIVDEWNYDSGANILPERSEKAYVNASYIPSRMMRMFASGIDYQLFFSLEDFNYQQEGVFRNVGAFWFDSEAKAYKGGAKSTYNIFRMLKELKDNLYLSSCKQEDEFSGVIATGKSQDISLLVYNYIDPEIARNYVSRNISTFKPAECRVVLNLLNSGKFANFVNHQSDIKSLGIKNRKTLDVFLKAQELNDKAAKFISTARTFKLTIKNLKEQYSYARYSVDSSCNINCPFVPVEEKALSSSDSYQETLTLNPYSVQLIVLKKKLKNQEAQAAESKEQAPAAIDQNAADKKQNDIVVPEISTKNNIETQVK